MSRRVLDVAAVLAALVATALLLPALLGFDRYVIVGGSMGTAIPDGSLVVDAPVGDTGVAHGDVVTFVRPDGGGVVTHRVIAAQEGQLTTRGDANATADPWRVAASDPSLRRVVFHVPFAGRIVGLLGPLALCALLALLAVRLFRASAPAREARA